MEQLEIFQNPEFGTIRTIRDDKGEPLFCGKDVAVALGYKKPENAIAVHVEDEDKTSTLIQGSGSNYKSKTTFINESGLYALILSSKLESARRFKHWVTAEVLPAIRKQGGYMVARTDESDEVIMARALQIMQAIQRKVIK
jgi:prophage antirepressor-like protein